MPLIATSRRCLGLLLILAGCASVSSQHPLTSKPVAPAAPPSPSAANSPPPAGPPEIQAASRDAEDLPDLVHDKGRDVRRSDPVGRVAYEHSVRTLDGAFVESAAQELVAAQPAGIALDLTTALGMAGGQNPQIALAAARYREAYARLEAAQVLWLPSIRAGVSYHHHDGNLQDVGGRIVDLSRSSLHTGLGVNAVGAGTTPIPGVVVQFHSSDAVFQPRIAAYGASAQRASMRTTTNDILLQTALAYLEVLRAYQDLRIREATRDNTESLALVTKSYAETGQGLRADADRVAAELVRRRNEVSRAEEATRVAAARLAEVLSTDPTIPILPQEPTIVPIDLVAAELPVAELVATGLSNRPELAEAQYLVCEAVHRYRRERYAPLLPSVLLGISQTGFGGGIGSDVEDFDGRFDLDAVAYWELQNLGLGEQARRDGTRASTDRARALEAQLLDRVAREVVEAHAQVTARSSQIAVAESGIEAATNSYRRNLARIQEGQGLPIEVLQSIQALDEARREYLRAVIEYNQAQFSLQRALGWPIR